MSFYTQFACQVFLQKGLMKIVIFLMVGQGDALNLHVIDIPFLSFK